MADRWDVTYEAIVCVHPRRMDLWIARQRRLPCEWCGCETENFQHPRHFRHGTIEHIVPQSRGGLTIPRNLKSACSRCNNGRQNCDECIGVFACALTIFGEKATLKQVGKWWSGIKRALTPELV